MYDPRDTEPRQNVLVSAKEEIRHYSYQSLADRLYPTSRAHISEYCTPDDLSAGRQQPVGNIGIQPALSNGLIIPLQPLKPWLCELALLGTSQYFTGRVLARRRTISDFVNLRADDRRFTAELIAEGEITSSRSIN